MFLNDFLQTILTYLSSLSTKNDLKVLKSDTKVTESDRKLTEPSRI